MSSAVVAIVGRPNVGKSTLFNRLAGTRKAIESDLPGTTRDRLYGKVDINGYNVLLVDTGGLELVDLKKKAKQDSVSEKFGSECLNVDKIPSKNIEESVQEQSKVAIEGADIVLFMVDVRQELTSEDFHAVDLLRKSKKPVILLANKCDNPSLEEQVFNLYELGFGEPVAISASHSEGLDIIESRLAELFSEMGFKRAERNQETNEERNEDSENDRGSEDIRIAFLGRPNVGKSTMINGILGKEAVVVSDTPGTTRDSTEISFDYKDHKFTLLDTAGLRRRGKIEKGIEKYSVLRTVRAACDADICVLILDFAEGITSQDCHVSNYILQQRKGLLLVVNKVDLEKGKVREDLENQFIGRLKRKMDYIPWAPVVFASGLKRKNIFKILDLASEIHKERIKKIPEGDLNIWLDETLAKHPPKGSRGKRRFNVLAVEQIAVKPPTFVFYCKWPEYMHFSYERFLENELRARFGFTGTAIKMIFKKPER